MTKLKIIFLIVTLLSIHPVYRWYMDKKSYEYFQQRCEQDAGEFIYRTVENVEGLFQMRPRDPRDYISRLRKGDIPDDPYGHVNMVAQSPHGSFLSVPLYKSIPYQYLETTKAPNLKDVRFPKAKLVKEPIFTGEKYWRYTFSHNEPGQGDLFEAIQVSQLQSQYGFTWREIRDDKGKSYGVWGGELIVEEISTGEILGIRRGYLFLNKSSDKSGVCPKKSENQTFDFVSKVLKPVGKKDKGE